MLPEIESVPYWYTKDFQNQTKQEGAIDSTYRIIIKMDTNAIVQLKDILPSTTLTKIPNSCNGGYFTYGQLAFLLINDIEEVPLGAVTRIQFDVLECSFLAEGVLDYIKRNGQEFKRKYSAYLSSEGRRKWLKSFPKGERKTYNAAANRAFVK